MAHRRVHTPHRVSWQSGGRCIHCLCVGGRACRRMGTPIPCGDHAYSNGVFADHAVCVCTHRGHHLSLLRTLNRDWIIVEPAMAPFIKKFNYYLQQRRIDRANGIPTWPERFGVTERDVFCTGPMA